MPKQQNLSLNESASIQYSVYGCYGRTALNPCLTMDGFRQIINTSSGTKLKLKNN